MLNGFESKSLQDLIQECNSLFKLAKRGVLDHLLEFDMDRVYDDLRNKVLLPIEITLQSHIDAEPYIPFDEADIILHLTSSFFGNALNNVEDPDMYLGFNELSGNLLIQDDPRIIKGFQDLIGHFGFMKSGDQIIWNNGEKRFINAIHFCAGKYNADAQEVFADFNGWKELYEQTYSQITNLIKEKRNACN